MNAITLTITDAQGVIMDSIDISGYDLSKSFARSELIMEIQAAQRNAKESNEAYLASLKR